jgi:2-iminobutanoate/2-iminopropanoate deaminase
MTRVISSPAAPKAIGPYSQAIVAGDLAFCSGQVALDPASGALVGDDVAAQTRQALTNLRAVLEAAGSSLQSVVRCTVYLRAMSDFTAMNDVYSEMFGSHRPSRTTVEVSGLPKDARVEIDAIGVIRSADTGE